MKRIAAVMMLMMSVVLVAGCTVSVNLGEPPAEVPVATLVKEPTQALPVPTVEILLPTDAPMQAVTVYFLNGERFAVGTEPYEDAFTRYVPVGSDLPRAVLDLFFQGPTDEELAQGVRVWTSGFTHVREMTVENGIARVYLGDVCANNGAAYSVAALIMKNLSQFPEITAVKIYDENDSTLDPDSSESSLPYCLEP